MQSILQRADHVIVLMMENRSFDHYLGYLSLAGRQDINGLTGDETNPYQGDEYVTFSLDNPKNDWRTSFPLKSAFWPDPIHAHCPTWTQLLNVKKCGCKEDKRHGKTKCEPITDCDPKPGEAIDMKGFARSYMECDPKETHNRPGSIMGHYTQRSLPAYHCLADNFCVVNQWFSANVGSTVPNRMFSLAGDSLGCVDNSQVAEKAEAVIERDRFKHVLEARTVFDALSDHQVSWRAYYHNLCALWLYNDYLVSPKVQLIDRLWRILDGKGREELPAVTWIDPAYTLEFNTGHPLDTAFGNDDHSPTDIRLGQALVKKLYDKLVASKYWERTLLIITYDEHGGFYDHVHPTPSPAADEFDQPPFQNYGVRVPTLLVAPFIERSSVVPDTVTFDHTSLIRSLLDRFCGGAKLNDAKPNRSDVATSLSVVSALDELRTDYPRALDGPNLDQVEKDLLAVTDEVERILVDAIRHGVSDWQEVLKLLSELREIRERVDSFFHRILRWLCRLLGLHKRRREMVPWTKEQLDEHVHRVVEAHRQ